MTYSRMFYSRTNRTAATSAARIVPLVADVLRPSSVLEVGSGGGAWLEAWSRVGVEDLLGIDVAPPAQSGYPLPMDTFLRADLARPFDLGRRFSLVQSLEVAEHLPESAASGFVRSLCRHADIVLFSAALPGQGGVHHINEQPYAYWRDLFGGEGYRPVDWLRHVLRDKEDVAWWYRYNILIYANEPGLASLPGHLVAAKVPERATISDVAPFFHRCRRWMLRPLPASFVTRLVEISDTALIRRFLELR